MGPPPTTLDYSGQEQVANTKATRITIGFSFTGTYFSLISFKRTDMIDQNETKAQGVSEYDLVFRYILLSQKNQHFRALQLTRNVEHGAGSVQTKQFPRKGYECQP